MIRYNEWMIKKIIAKVCCFFVGHEFTCNHQKGIAVTEEQLKAGVKGFFDYATMYCDRCGKVFKR